MLDPETFAAYFARVVDLFRDPSAKEDQKEAFRAIIGMLYEAGVCLKVEGGRIVTDGRPLDSAVFTALSQRLELHGVSEITIPQDPSPSHLFELVRALADPPGAEDIPTRLRAAGADGIRVAIAAVASPSSLPADALGTAGIVQGLAMADVVALAPPAAVIAPESAPAPSAPPAPKLPAPPPKPESLEEILAELERQPRGPASGDHLAALVRLVEAAVKSGGFVQAVGIIAGVVRIEQKLPEGGLRRPYGAAIKRMCTRPVLEGLAQLLSAPASQGDAALALQRTGADGVEVLVDLLIAASTVPERRTYFNALTQMKEGTDQLVHLLGHHQWYIVRNVAELIGELGLEKAVPALTKQLGHADERVRKAVALALAKIGTPATVEPLRRALRDEAAAVRTQVAMGIGGRKSSSLAMTLVVALEEEEDGSVVRELILALGRIGTADAVQALITLAQPSGRLFSRKPTAQRVAAVEGLRLAATPAAVGTLQGLAGDSDREVRAAVQRALSELKRREPPLAP